MINLQQQPTTTHMGLFQNKEASELPNAIIEAISNYTDKRKKPKRNRSAFILFSIDIREKLKPKELEELNPNDKFVRIAQLWKELTDSERKVYEEKAKQEKERYTNELSDFCRIFPSEPIQRPRNHIKKPCNAYGYYLKEIKESIRKEKPELRMCEVLRIVGERWKKLSAEEKQRFEKQAEASRKIFKAEVSKQMEAVKKVKFSNGSSPVQKSPEAHQIDMDDLVCKDLYIPDYRARQNIQRQAVKTPTLKRSTSTDKKNILADLEQLFKKSKQSSPVIQPTTTISSPAMSASSNGMTTNVNNIKNINMNMMQLNPLCFGLEDSQNKAMTNMALEGLYWKVEGLRRQILFQMKSMGSGQATNNGLNPLLLQLLAQQQNQQRVLNQDLLSVQSLSTCPGTELYDYKKEEI